MLRHLYCLVKFKLRKSFLELPKEFTKKICFGYDYLDGKTTDFIRGN